MRIRHSQCHGWPWLSDETNQNISRHVTDIFHYNDVIMSLIASQITSLTIVYTTVYSDVHQRKHQSSASLAFVRGIHRGPVNSPHKGPVTRKIFPFDDVIMLLRFCIWKLCSTSPKRCSDQCCLKLIEASDAYMRQQIRPSLVQIMACRLLGTKPLSDPMMDYWP